MKSIQRRQKQRGATLAAVFWIMAVMGLALVKMIQVAKYQSAVAGTQLNVVKARQFAEMGLNMAANPSVQKWDQALLRRTFEGGGYEASIHSEGGRFNINYILGREDRDLLVRMFDSWGVDPSISPDIVDSLIDWVDTDDLVQLNGAEKDFYERQGFLGRPFNRPFYDLDEVRLVRGMELVEAANPGWQDWFSIWSTGALDVSEASAELLAMAADVAIEEGMEVVQFRKGEDGIKDTEDDVQMSVEQALELMGIGEDPTGGQILGRFGARDPITRIESVGRAGTVRRKLVLVLSARSANPQILERKEVVMQ